MTSPAGQRILPVMKNGPINCQTCGIESNAYQKLRWKEASLEGENAILRRQLFQQGHGNQLNLVAAQQALADRQEALEARERDQRLATDAFRRESMAHEETKLSLKYERKRFQKFRRFVDSLHFTKANPDDGPSVSALWQAREQRRNSSIERSDLESRTVDMELGLSSLSDSSTSDGQSPKRKRVGLLRPV